MWGRQHAVALSDQLASTGFELVELGRVDRLDDAHVLNASRHEVQHSGIRG
jgi:hypothetical protein